MTLGNMRELETAKKARVLRFNTIAGSRRWPSFAGPVIPVNPRVAPGLAPPEDCGALFANMASAAAGRAAELEQPVSRQGYVTPDGRPRKLGVDHEGHS
jgi:hypothetical protein